MILDREVDTDTGCVGLFSGLGEEDDIAIERHAIAFQEQHDHQVGGQHRLVIDGSAAPYIAVLDDCTEGFDRPLLRLDPDDIGVRKDQQQFSIRCP